MDTVNPLKNFVLSGEVIGRKEALLLYKAPLKELCLAADEIRETFCADRFDLCMIINGKSGRCPENCKYCAQSTFYSTSIEAYSLLGTEYLLTQAKAYDKKGVLRFSIVTSGKALSDQEVDQVCESVRQIRQQTSFSVCVSLGLLKEKHLRCLKEAGVTRIHNNLETSRRYFPEICTTHTYEDKIETICAAKHVGLAVCSGGIMGLGETPDDRIDMALTLRSLGIKSIPINMLNPIPGTPLYNNFRLSKDDMRRIVAIYRFLLPDAEIRLAGGRGLLDDKGYSCFLSGANAAITGDMLTTSGISIETDKKMLNELNYKAVL